MLNAIDLYKGIFLLVTPVRIIVPLCIQRTLLGSILLILCFCFVLHYFILMSLLQMNYIFLPWLVHKTKMPLTVFHCHTILIENVCRLLCKSMLPTMFINYVCKIKAHSFGIICGSRETYFKGKCSIMIKIHQLNLLEIM